MSPTSYQTAPPRNVQFASKGDAQGNIPRSRGATTHYPRHNLRLHGAGLDEVLLHHCNYLRRHINCFSRLLAAWLLPFAGIA